MNQPHSPSERSVRHARVVTAICFVGIVLIVSESPLWAQAKKPSAKPPEKAFEEVTLDTKDGVIIQCTYYPGPEKKTTVPLILLHDWNGSRTDLHSLASYAQQTLGHTVIVPDLRGHGTSVRRRVVNDPIDRDKMNKLDIESMVWDVEAVKSYLLQRNNEEKLNIEQLGVLGVGVGGTLALNWAIGMDWSARDLPSYKMGRDVKALILISPRQSFKGITVNPVLKNRLILSQLSLLIVCGTQDSERNADAKRILKAFEAAHDEDQDKDAVRFYEADTTLQGTDLIYDRELRVPDWISGCTKTRLVDRAVLFPWTDRTSPLK